MRFYDYRPPGLELDDLSCEAANLTALPFDNETIWSLSCMHVAEHVGLGRYGDELDPEGDVKAMSELSRVLARGGSLLFVVPVGKPRIRFNAHRIYSFEQVMDGFPTLRLHEFSLIPDSSKVGGLIRNARPELANAQDYGCGCFWFRKAE